MSHRRGSVFVACSLPAVIAAVASPAADTSACETEEIPTEADNRAWKGGRCDAEPGKRIAEIKERRI